MNSTARRTVIPAAEAATLNIRPLVPLAQRAAPARIIRSADHDSLHALEHGPLSQVDGSAEEARECFGTLTIELLLDVPGHWTRADVEHYGRLAQQPA